MAKRKNWLSYEQASKIATDAGCKSRKQFMDWHKEKGISDIPKQPNRVYSEWEGWPEFLNTRNIFASDKDKESNYRKFWDAVRWSQAYCAEHGITTGQGWKHAYSADREKGINEIPEDIPKHPENYYKEEWAGWVAWLGKSVSAKVEAAKQEVAIMCLAGATWAPANVITIVMARDGEAQLLDMLHNQQLIPKRMFKFEQEYADQLRTLFNECGTLQHTGGWIIQNPNYLMSEISYILEVYKPTDIEGFRRLVHNHNQLANPHPTDGFDLDDDKHTKKLSNTGTDFI